MTIEEFNNNILKCRTCGDIPTIVEVRDLIGNDIKGYQVICTTCQWEDGSHGNRTGICKTPENAVNRWNHKFGLKE